jgi:acetylornithine deacetylase
MNDPIDREFILEVLTNLVKINSINPSLSPDGVGEAQIGAYIAEVLESIGLHATTHELAPGRVNVVGTLKGQGKGRTLLLNAHMDTVGVDGMQIDPFGAEIRDGRLYGRGAQDMKGSLAAMIGAAKAFVDSGIQLGGDLMVTAVADEEYASIGTEDLVKRIAADGAIVTEPSDLKIALAHRGFIWYQVETFGRAAHGSRYQEGIDANMRMGRFLALLDRLEQELRSRKGHPWVGPPSLHAARIQGGREISMYAAHCSLEIERRTIPGESETQVRAELQALIDHLSAQDPTFQARLQPVFIRPAFEVDQQESIVRSLAAGIQHSTHLEPTYTGQSFWTDAAILADAGIDTVLIGPTGSGLHSAEEWVDIQSVATLAAILAATAVEYCGLHKA